MLRLDFVYFSEVFRWEALWSTPFVRNTLILHALFVRGFRGLLLLVDLEVY